MFSAEKAVPVPTRVKVMILAIMILLLAVTSSETLKQPYYITVNGKKTVLVESKDSAQRAINDVIEVYKENHEEILDIQLAEDTVIEKMDIKNGDEMPKILTEEEAVKELLTGKKGESYLTVVITKEETQHRPIEYEEKYKPDPTMYVGETKIEREGEDGLKEVTEIIVSENGETVEKKIMASETIKEPVQQTILTGTKNFDGYGGGNAVADEGVSYQKGETYTTLTNPVEDICITSEFGPRWGSVHYGLDLGAQMGNNIYAADDGVVYHAEYSGGYGNLIKIDHGNGMQTYYAHCNDLLVSEGQHVKQGEVIGLIGSTGNSTGPHLHFEVIINRTRVDPVDFLDIK